MSIDEQSLPGPKQLPAHSRFFFEAGTWRFILVIVAAIAAYVIYGQVHSYFLLQKQWPALAPGNSTLTVLGLLDQGDRAKYKAIEANHAWQVRRTDDNDDSDVPEDKEAAADRGNNPGQSPHQAIKGRVVTVAELMKNLPTVMTAQHFTGAWVEEHFDAFRESNYYIVHVSLNDEGRSRYYQFSKEHDGERLVFVIGGEKGEISICPRMKHMDVSELDVEQYWVKADADRLADVINGKK